MNIHLNQKRSFSSLFVDKPRFAIVISLVIMILGTIGILNIPVSQFPDITPPQIAVSANYPGASAKVIEQVLGSPIEDAVNGVDNMIYMSSTSDNGGNYSLNISFEVGTDPDMAVVNVQNRVAIAEPKLPEEVIRNGLHVRKQSNSFLQIFSIVSDNPEHTELFLNNYAKINIIDQLSRINGVGNAAIFGEQEYSMRIWTNPDKMSSVGITSQDLINAIRRQNLQASAGQIAAPPVNGDETNQYTVQVRGRLSKPSEFERIIVKTGTAGSVIRLKDIAKVELGAKSYAQTAEIDGKSSVNMAVYLASGANALEVANSVKSKMEEISNNFPEGVSYVIPYDTTLFVNATIIEVITTLLITFSLVVLVTYVFLGDWHATIIPSMAVPVSLIGTFGIMLGLGYSVNTITLFALVLAIGIVVDDAIVVVEHVKHIMKEKQLNSKEATRIAMGEITSAIISTTLVLLAVFVPVAFLPGITGQLYKQFAVTLSAAVSLSTIVSLTLSPALCGMILKNADGHQNFVIKIFELKLKFFRGIHLSIIKFFLKQKFIAVLILAGAAFSSYYIYNIIPTGLLPTEDRGAIFINVQLPDSASLSRTTKVIDGVEKILLSNPAIKNTFSVNGFSLMSGSNSSNGGLVVAILKDWKDRPEGDAGDFFKILNQTRGQLFAIPSASIFAFTMPSIEGLGNTNGFDFKLQDRKGTTPQELAEVMRSMIIAANQHPDLQNVFSTFSASVPQIFVDVNREKAELLGVPLNVIYQALQANLGSFYVNDFNYMGRTFQVIIQAEKQYRDNPDDIAKLHVKNNKGEMVPLSTLVTVSNILDAEIINRYNQFRSVSISGEAKAGKSSGDAIIAMQNIADEILPDGFSYEWSGLSYQETQTSSQGILVFGLALLFAYLFLVANYESFAIPLSVILSIIIAVFGAVMGMWLSGSENNIYSQIGMILLVALASKNAILIVEFSKARREEGASIFEAAVEGARLRYRAVLMTSFSFVFGILPLLFAEGAGAISRQSIGITVFYGMLSATVIGIIFVPVLFAIFEGLREMFGKKES